MALNATRLRDAIVARLDLSGLNATEENNVKAVWLAISEEIITEFTTNSVVTGTDSNGDTHALAVT